MADDPKLVKKKIRIRGGRRGYIKQVITQARESLSIEKSPENARLLKQYKATLVDKLHELKSLDSEIAELLPDDETIDKDILESCEFAGVMRRCIIELECSIDQITGSGVNSSVANEEEE